MPPAPLPAHRILHDPAWSGHREQLLQHEFVGALLKDAWFRRDQPVEILWPEVDFAGYDVVVTCNRVTRQIQLKSSNAGGKVRSQKVNVSLASAPSGCIVWSVAMAIIEADPPTVEVVYRAFGSDIPGAAMSGLAGFAVAKHSKGNAQGVKALRPNIRVLPNSAFQKFSRVSELSDWLFGPKA